MTLRLHTSHTEFGQFSILMMQVKVYTCSSSSSNLHSPWTQIRELNVRPKTSLKLSTRSNSLKTSSFNHEFQEEEKIKLNLNLNLNNSSNQEKVSLPVVFRHSGAVSRYFWDGNDLKLVSIDGINDFSLLDFSLDFGDGVRKLSRVCGSAVRDFFLPRAVSDNYLGYVKWKFLHRVFSSALQVLATQAMFRAIGIGKSCSLASAAALNWVLKDGLGRLSRCIYTATLASAFDTNLKRVRFSTSVLFTLSIGVELFTPAFPEYFLLLATIANIAKQISLSCYLATGTAVHRSFAIVDNLGEVSAKAQIQTVCFDNLGLMLAAGLNILFKNNQRLQAGLPFVVYPIFSAIDLFGIYQGLKYVHLQTLTKDRLEMIMNTWINLGYVPSPAEVSKEEGIDFFWSKDRKLLPIRIGCLNPKSQLPKLSMMTMRSLNDEDFYFICMESLTEKFKKIRDHGILLCLREGASTGDVIMGLLQACYFRNSLLLNRNSWEKFFEGCDFSDSNVRQWFKLKEDSKQSAQVNLILLNEQMSRLGWACKNILLSTQERARYSFVAN